MSILLVLFVGNSFIVPIHSNDITNFEYANPISDDVSYEYRNPSLGIYAAEAGAALLVGNAVGYGTVVLLSLGYETPSGTHQPPTSILVYPFIYPFASALGVHVVGRSFKCPGSYWGAVGGGFIGMVAGLGSLYLLGDDNTQYYGLMLALALPPIFSTVGYHMFGGKTYSQSDLPMNVDYCTMTLHSLERNEVVTCQKISINIVSIAF